MVVGRVLKSDVVDEKPVAGKKVQQHRGTGLTAVGGRKHPVVRGQNIPPTLALTVDRPAAGDFEIVHILAEYESVNVSV